MDIKLSFWGAAGNVTGSCYLLEAGDTRVLIDCGLYQEWDLKGRNWEPFPVPPDSIDAVLLTHAHLDHCGRLPRLVREGFRGKIFCTPACGEIARIVLLDSANIQEEDAEYKRKRHQREGREGPYPELPLYTMEDAEACFPLFANAEYEKPVTVAKGIQTTFFDAGHILGSAMILIRIRQNGGQRWLLFSGDAGRWDAPILQDPTLFDHADYIIMEGTYSDRSHDHSTSVADQLAEVILDTRKRGGNVVIPSFAIERSQDILYYLNELLIAGRIPPVMVFLDSPMAVQVTGVFEHHHELLNEETAERMRQGRSPFQFPGLVMVRSVEQSKAINDIKGTTVIIAGSGMATGGRIKHHLAANISRPESTILFVGYQAQGTLGREIVNGAREVRILGQVYPVKAKVVQVGGLSAHADKDDLVKWLSGLKMPPREVFITHAEADAAEDFADFLRGQNGWKVSAPAYRDEVFLN